MLLISSSLIPLGAPGGSLMLFCGLASHANGRNYYIVRMATGVPKANNCHLKQAISSFIKPKYSSIINIWQNTNVLSYSFSLEGSLKKLNNHKSRWKYIFMVWKYCTSICTWCFHNATKDASGPHQGLVSDCFVAASWNTFKIEDKYKHIQPIRTSFTLPSNGGMTLPEHISKIGLNIDDIFDFESLKQVLLARLIVRQRIFKLVCICRDRHKSQNLWCNWWNFPLSKQLFICTFMTNNNTCLFDWKARAIWQNNYWRTSNMQNNRN